MDWNKIDKEISRSPRYLFFKKYQRIFIFIQGFIVIGLLFGIVMYMIQDREIKEQIRDNCGYVTDSYECLCDKHYVDNWKDLKSGNFQINFSEDNLDG